MFLWSSATKSSIKSLRALENQSETAEGVPMLDFTNSSDHGALKKTTNVKVWLDVLWPLFSVTSAPHGNFYVQVIQNFVYWFHFANISVLKLRWDLPVPKIATIWVLLRSCSSETLELWPRYFFELIQVFFIESIMDLSMLKSLRSCTMGFAPMELLSYRFFLNGL